MAGLAYKGKRFDGVYLGRVADGETLYAGKVEQGFTDEQVEHLERLAKGLEAKRPPFNAERAFPKAKWPKPELLADVDYRRKTAKGGLLRHPSYKGLRKDLM